MEANNMDPYQTSPREKSDLGPYCLQYRLVYTSITYADERTDDKSCDWWAKG